MSANISAVPNLGNTCYLLHALYLLFIISSFWQSIDEFGTLAVRVLGSMQHRSKETLPPVELIRQLAASIFPSTASQQQDVQEAFVHLISHLVDPGRQEILTTVWNECQCGRTSAKYAGDENFLVVSTEESSANLDDLINSSVQRNDDGWKCGALDCPQNITSLSTINGVRDFVVVFIKRPVNLPRTDIAVPMKMSLATYQDGGGATPIMVDMKVRYVIFHSTKGGNVTDASDPDSFNNSETGHYFACENTSADNSHIEGCIVDCLAEVPNATCDNMSAWVKERGRKVVAVMYTTVKQSKQPVDGQSSSIEVAAKPDAMSLKRKVTETDVTKEPVEEKKQKTSNDDEMPDLESLDAAQSKRRRQESEVELLGGKKPKQESILSITSAVSEVCEREKLFVCVCVSLLSCIK